MRQETFFLLIKHVISEPIDHHHSETLGNRKKKQSEFKGASHEIFH